jgi:ribosomal protein S18 acetylase RimI-like enzyme
MTATIRNYDPAADFGHVRDFLSACHQITGAARNWRIERWNYARYFIAPFVARLDGEPTPEESRQAIRFWEDHVALWEDAAGHIVGVVTIEKPWLGDVWVMRHPRHNDDAELTAAMLDHAEAHLAHPEKKTLTIHIGRDDETLAALARERGYAQDENQEHDALYVMGGELPAPNLPEGYVVRSMADVNDIHRRREAFGRGFNHPDPPDWPSAFSYEELQRAPDYRRDLDLYVVAPDGQFVSFCIVWYDALNRMGSLEPVGTHPDYRRRGLAREVVMEGVRRVAALGAERVWVGSGQEFYQAIGFEIAYYSYAWTRTFA